MLEKRLSFDFEFINCVSRQIIYLRFLVFKTAEYYLFLYHKVYKNNNYDFKVFDLALNLLGPKKPCCERFFFCTTRKRRLGIFTVCDHRSSVRNSNCEGYNELR